jgi:hypothetical protein
MSESDTQCRDGLTRNILLSVRYWLDYISLSHSRSLLIYSAGCVYALSYDHETKIDKHTR